MKEDKHAFWIDSKGKPDIHRIDAHAPLRLLELLSECPSVSKLGLFSNDNSYDNEIRNIVAGKIAIRTSRTDVLTDAETESIVFEAIKKCANKPKDSKAFDQKSFLEEVDVCTKSYLSSNSSKFHVITSLSVYAWPRKTIKICDCTISRLSKKVRNKRYSLPEKSSIPPRIREHIDPPEYQLVKISTKARSLAEAACKTSHALDSLRALWTLGWTYGSKQVTLGTRTKAIGIFHASAFSTIHHDSNSGSTRWLYNPTFPHIHKPYPKIHNAAHWSVVEENRLKGQRRISKINHKFHKQIHDLLRMYVNALDPIDLDLSFIKLWTVLEHITSSVGDRYDVTIKRAIWWCKDRKRHKEVLEYLRCRRNQIIHHGRSKGESEDACYRLKSIIDVHLDKLISGVLPVSSIQEYAEYLDLPASESELRKAKNKINTALQTFNG